MLLLIPSLIALLQATPAPSPHPSAIASPAISSPAPTATPACAGHDRDAQASTSGTALAGAGDGTSTAKSYEPTLTQIAVYIDEHGDLYNAVVYQSSGDHNADQAALRSAETGTYIGAIKHCVGIKSVLIITPQQ